MVADEDQLRPGRLHMGGETDQVDMVGHADLIAEDQAPAVEADPAVLEPPDQAG